MAISGDRLRDARKYRGKGQEEVAAEVGCEQSYISKLERDKMQGGIRGDELLKLARFLDFDPRVFDTENPMSFKEGDLEDAPERRTITELVAEVASLKQRVTPLRDEDPLLERVRVNNELRDMVESIQHLDAHKLRELHALAFAYLARGRGQDSDDSERDPSVVGSA